jgi:cytochrome c553
MLKSFGKAPVILGMAILLASPGASDALAQSRSQAQPAPPAAKAPPAKKLDGKKLYSDKGCVNCHGADAKTPLQPGYPKLAGQFADYTESQLLAFKTKDRSGGDAELMHAQADQLSFEEITAIAVHVSKLPRN